jgi:membrane fusion protein, multidrug efflux system
MVQTRTFPWLAAALLLAVCVAACSSEAQQQTPSAAGGGRGGGRGGAQNAPVPVTVAQVEQRTIPIELESIGTVIAATTVQVRSQITGEMTAVHFKEGEDVKQGQLLVSLDKRPLESALEQARATLARDEAQAKNARAQAVRYLDLQQRGIATKEQVDQITAQAAALDATVNADRAAVDSAKVQLEYATIDAPISGRTGLLQVHPGNLIRANDTIPIVTINRVTPVYVSFAVPEGQLPQLKHYMAQGELKVRARAPDEPGGPSFGRINFVDNAVDVTTGTIKVKGTFPNEDLRLWPGQFVNVVVTLSQDPNAVVVPAPAVQVGQQGQYVFVVKTDQTVELRPVTVARSNGTSAVIKAGVKPGETVVTDGQLRLVPGSRISVKDSKGAEGAQKAVS